MKLEIRLDKDDSYSVVDTYFLSSMLDPCGMGGLPNPIVSGLTKEEAQAILKAAETHKEMGYNNALWEAARKLDELRK